MRGFLLSITRNALGLIGAALTTASAVLILTLFGIGLLGFHGSPYVGIITYLILPALFVFGLVLIPLGVWQQRRRERRAAERGEAPPAFPVIDLNRDRVRRMFLVFVAATVLNLMILALATYKGVEVMDSTAFCGTSCHTVMMPEYTTYQRSPHSRVACVSCHIGPGADWFVKSKLSGSWQLVSVAFKLYPKPIPTPVHDLRPARETCEQCHWPTRFVGDRLKVVARYAADETNTATKTVALFKVGGAHGGETHGIHWHVDPGNEVRYRGDPSRKTISEIELRRPDGSVKRFVSSAAAAADGAPGAAEEWRVMDCVDCHNRPTHIYRMPGDEVDAAFEAGKLDPTLPFLKREALKALEAQYASHDEARQRIPAAIEAFYRESYPERSSAGGEAIRTSGAALADIYCRNVFPSMNIGWGTYPSHLGHTNSDGCFRCHDGEHKTAEGEAISQDCSLCHNLLAVEEADPAILQQLHP